MDRCWPTAFLQLKVFHGRLKSGIFEWMSVRMLRELERYVCCVGGLLIYFVLQICGGRRGRQGGEKGSKEESRKKRFRPVSCYVAYKIWGKDFSTARH